MGRLTKLAAAVAACGMLAAAAPSAAEERISSQSRVSASVTTPHSAIRLISAVRRNRGLPALRHDPRLDRAAAMHARDMASRRFFSHRGSNGSKAFHRIRSSGYNACYAAEYIARGPSTSAQAARAWIRSPGHLRNILSRKPIAAGVAKAPGNYWVMVFARPC